MSRNVQRRDVLKGAGVAGITALAGCANLPGGGGGRTVQQGVLLPLTGDLASVGEPIRDGAILPAAQLEGETDFTIDIQEEDTQTDPSAGISAAESLVNSGYPAINGPASSGVNLQVTKQVLIPNQTIGCSPSSTSPNVTTLDDDDYVFRTAPSDALQGQVLAQLAGENVGASSASTMFVNNDYGQALSQSFADSFESDHDGTVQRQVSFEKEQSSYSSRLERALSNDPDTMVVIGYPASGIQLFRDFYSDFGTDLPILVTDGLEDPALPDDVGNDMNNVMGTSPQPSGPGRDAFDQLYQDEYGREPGVFNAHAYDATAVCVLANVRAGDNTGSAVRDEMRNVANPGDGRETFNAGNLADAVEAAAAGDQINYQGASSAVDFDDNGDMRAVSYKIFAFQGGEIETQETVQFGQ